MENKTTIKLSDGRELVVEVNNYDGNHEGICVYTLDKTNPKNMLFQDICIVREDEKEPGRVECLVWADANEECYNDLVDMLVTDAKAKIRMENIREKVSA